MAFRVKITVKQPVTKVKLNKSTLTVSTGRTAKLKATALPTTANSKKVTWTSSNEEVAVVDANGRVTGAGSGAAVITATATDKDTGAVFTDTAVVTVKNGYIYDYFEPTSTIVTGEEYLIGYKNGNTVYLLMNYNPNPVSSNNYYYSSSSNYYGYAVRAVMDGNNVVGVDTTTMTNATLDHVEWKFVSNGSYYKIQSGYNSSYYLRVYKSSSYADCYPASGTSYATNWKFSNNMLSYYVSSSVTKYMTFYAGAADDYGFFGAPTSGGSNIVLFQKVG